MVGDSAAETTNGHLRVDFAVAVCFGGRAHPCSSRRWELFGETGWWPPLLSSSNSSPTTQPLNHRTMQLGNLDPVDPPSPPTFNLGWKNCVRLKHPTPRSKSRPGFHELCVFSHEREMEREMTQLAARGARLHPSRLHSKTKASCWWTMVTKQWTPMQILYKQTLNTMYITFKKSEHCWCLDDMHERNLVNLNLQQ